MPAASCTGVDKTHPLVATIYQLLDEWASEPSMAARARMLGIPSTSLWNRTKGSSRWPLDDFLKVLLIESAEGDSPILNELVQDIKPRKKSESARLSVESDAWNTLLLASGQVQHLAELLRDNRITNSEAAEALPGLQRLLAAICDLVQEMAQRAAE